MELIVEHLLKQLLDHIHQLHLNLKDLLMLYQNLDLMFVDIDKRRITGAMLMVSSIEVPRVFVLKPAGDRTHASFPNSQRQMHLVLGDITCVQLRAVLPQGRSQLSSHRLDLSPARDNAPVRYTAQSDVVPTEGNRR